MQWQIWIVFIVWSLFNKVNEKLNSSFDNCRFIGWDPAEQFGERLQPGIKWVNFYDFSDEQSKRLDTPEIFIKRNNTIH